MSVVSLPLILQKERQRERERGLQRHFRWREIARA